MAVYRVTIAKQLIDGHDALHPWSNVYHISQTSMAEASLAAPTLVDLEKTLYPDNVRIIRYSVADPLVPQSGFSVGVNESGNRSIGSVASQLPRWNVLRAKLNVPTGRPSQMSLRIIPDESEVDDGKITTAVYDGLVTGWATPLFNLGYVCDEDGQVITGVLLLTTLYNRQTGWHRRTRPGQHRGWVPD
jgi:hypothetical protein